MEVKPFRAFRFNPQVVGDAGQCIAPPYDVISDDEREELYRRSEHNIVRITKGKAVPGDNGQHNVYSRAAEYLSQWIAEGALRQDDQEIIYAYIQDFELNGVAYERLNFIALGRLEEFGKVVRPHEQVFAKPLTDRLNLERATRARFGLVFMLYDDPQGVADRIIEKAAGQAPPEVAPASHPCTPGDAARPQERGQDALATSATQALIDFVDDQSTRHRLYAIADEDDIRTITDMMAEKSCIIADGHHRYTTGLTYLRESGNPAAKYQMLAFTNTRQKGLVVLATHRLVGGISDFQPLDFLARLEDGFKVLPFKFAPDAGARDRAKERMLAEMRYLHEKGKTVLGIYMRGGPFYVAILKDPSHMDAAAPGMSPAWRTLDVSVLQKLVLEGLLRFDEEMMGSPEHVEYVKDMPNAMNGMIARIDAGHKQIAFFTNPVKMEQLTRVTDAGERMPHKSTYFYPKMYTGLTIQKL